MGRAHHPPCPETKGAAGAAVRSSGNTSTARLPIRAARSLGGIASSSGAAWWASVRSATSRRAEPPGSAAAANRASAVDVSDAMAIFSPGLRRRRCSVRRRARAPVMAADSSAPAPRTVRRFSGLLATAVAGTASAMTGRPGRLQ
ncbi:hypothetical protein ADL00_45795 [Streptomyces sp. AS58]|nr:hypothetical protein ADL00_45795 [Streptomyces sp. AS58]